MFTLKKCQKGGGEKGVWGGLAKDRNISYFLTLSLILLPRVSIWLKFLPLFVSLLVPIVLFHWEILGSISMILDSGKLLGGVQLAQIWQVLSVRIYFPAGVAMPYLQTLGQI